MDIYFGACAQRPITKPQNLKSPTTKCPGHVTSFAAYPTL
jgi:hypothetical protein